MSGTDGYERRIGRYGGALADALIQVAGVREDHEALDVGCGSGALTERLAARVGGDSVSAVDPSPSAVAACRARLPAVDVQAGFAEDLPFPDERFDAVLAQLVFGFVDDGAAGVAEMRRVARPGGAVATCVWDFAGGMTVLRIFWDAARDVDPAGAAAHDQASTHRNSRPEDLDRLWRGAGLRDVATGAVTVAADYAGFDDLWEPLTIPDGAPGRFYATLDDRARSDVRAGVLERLGKPSGPFRLSARAWYAIGRR